MKKILLLGALVMVFGVSTEAFAQRRDNRSDRRRIQRGIRSGQITRAEAQAIRARERQNRAERRAYRSDGVLTREERREIRRDERQSDRLIRQSRRDDDRRRGNGYYRRGRGSRSHPVFGDNNRRRGRRW